MNIAKIICEKCEVEFEGSAPDLAVMNAPHVSVVAGAHEETQACPNCGQHYLPVVANVQLEWRFVMAAPQVKEEKSRISIAPASTSLSNLLRK